MISCTTPASQASCKSTGSAWNHMTCQTQVTTPAATLVRAATTASVCTSQRAQQPLLHSVPRTCMNNRSCLHPACLYCRIAAHAAPPLIGRNSAFSKQHYYISKQSEVHEGDQVQGQQPTHPLGDHTKFVPEVRPHPQALRCTPMCTFSPSKQLP